MSKKIVIDKEKVERSEHSELIKTAISLLIKHGVATEIDTDKSIDLPTEEEITHHWKRNNCFGHYLEGLEHGSMWMRELSIKQSLIEQMKAKELNLQKNNECKNSSHNGEVKWTGKCSVCDSKLMN